MHIQKNTNAFQKKKISFISGSKLIVHRYFKPMFTIFYNIYKKLQKQAYDKSELANAYTFTDNASLVIKWMNEYNLY